MTKYRIVESKIPELLNDGVTIKYTYRYDIEYQKSLLFGLIKRWTICAYGFATLELAKARIEFWKEKEIWKVIDVD